MKSIFLRLRWFVMLTCTFSLLPLYAQQKGGHQIAITLLEGDTREAVVMGSVKLEPTGIMTVTDIDGRAILENVPTGEYTLVISYVGYETINAKLKVEKNLDVKYVMKATTLKLKEVSVTAKQNVAGRSSASIIGRQAIDHLQATSLADVMQLIPGQLMGNNDLTSAQNLQLRSLVNNNTNAFGSSIVMDGVPMSNNGVLSQGGFSSTSFVGTDLRRISADDIDNVEVIRGIPSAEYGDLTSGLVVVHSKVGVTPWQIKGKVTPALMNASLGKGFNAGNAGIFNVSLDYAKAWGDPRNKTQTFNRYNGSLAWGYNFSKKWHADTKLRFMENKSGTGDDPDYNDYGRATSNRTTQLSLSHNGKINFDLPLLRTLSYTLGLSYTDTKSSQTDFTSAPVAVITARETGYYDVPMLTQSYQATGITESRPGNVFFKIHDAFFFRKDKLMQSFKVGLQYSCDWNSGKGYYNVDESRPLRPNDSGRPRAFSDIPSIHQVSAFAEDNVTYSFNEVNKLRAQLGLRFTTMQPFSSVSTTALSPRINFGFDVTRFLTLRLGFGLNSKMPSLDYIYPDKKYDDRTAAAYYAASDPAATLYNYHTQVYDVRRSEGLKNATTTKWEAGVDIKLKNGAHFNVLGYYDKTPNGFGNVTEYITYASNYYDASSGLILNPGQATTIDYANPARTDIVYMTTGKVGNTNTAINRGIEFDLSSGEIKPLHTTLYLSGAYSETKTYSTDLNSANIRAALLPTSYTQYNTVPFKVVYPSGQDYDKYRRMVLTLREVTNIPTLRMVASFTAQAILYDWHHSFVSSKNAIGYITPDLEYHDISADMMNGYLDLSGQYLATATDEAIAAKQVIAINQLSTKDNSAVPSKSPVTWNLQGRLTKELGDFGSLSLYVNNILFYEPYLRGNNTTSLVQRNTGTWSYGVEISVKL